MIVMRGNMILAVLVFYPFVGAVVSGLIGRKSGKVRDFFADFVVVSEFLITLTVFLTNVGNGEGVNDRCVIYGICGWRLGLQIDGFRKVYVMIAAFMWMMTTILSREYMEHHKNKNRYYLFFLATLGATMGVFLSFDLYTLFIFFEIMSFTSYVWVAQEETQISLKAAATYLAVSYTNLTLPTNSRV